MGQNAAGMDGREISCGHAGVPNGQKQIRPCNVFRRSSGSDRNEVHETAAAANTLANTAKNTADSALTKVGEVNSELETANQEIDALQANLETLSNEMTTSYAKKSDLTQISTDLGTRIDQNAAQISSTATKGRPGRDQCQPRLFPRQRQLRQ